MLHKQTKVCYCLTIFSIKCERIYKKKKSKYIFFWRNLNILWFRIISSVLMSVPYIKVMIEQILNYISISFLSNLTKLFETVLYYRIFPTIRNYIQSNQHDFMDRRTTIFHITVFAEHVSQVVHNQGFYVFYTDYAKAFDRMDHGILLTNLWQIGVDAPLV